MTPQEELDLVNALLTQAAGNGGVAEWQEGAHKVRLYSLRELLDWKKVAETKVYQSTYNVLMPVREVDV